MASRIFWILLAGAALATGMVLQDGDHIFSWGDHDGDKSAVIEAKVDRAIDRSIDKSIDRTDVVTADGREVRITPEQEHALTEAIGRLVKAESDLVLVKVRRGDDKEVEAATVERDQARTRIEQLKAEIARNRQGSATDRDATSREIERDIRDEVRDSIREAARG